MADKPTVLPQWASDLVQNEITGQYNVVEPPTEKKEDGWFYQEKPNRQWWNWLHRQTYLWLAWLSQQEAQKVVTDDAGLGLFPTDDALITISAVDLDDPTSFFTGTGIKVAGQPPQFAITDSLNLALGAGTITGDQPITGGTNVIVTGTTSIIPS